MPLVILGHRDNSIGGTRQDAFVASKYLWVRKRTLENGSLDPCYKLRLRVGAATPRVAFNVFHATVELPTLVLFATGPSHAGSLARRGVE